MAKYVFTGDYQTHVSLPDQSVVLVDPGETVELAFDEPGPLWAGVRTEAAKTAKAAKIPEAPAPDAETAPPTQATVATPESEQS